jgi:hypothetical protein
MPPHRSHSLGGERLEGDLHQPPAEALALPLFADSHVLDLGLTGLAGAGQLQVPDDLRPCPRDEDPPRVQMGVQLGGRILGQREQRPQRVAVAGVAVEPADLRRPESLAVETDDFIGLVGGARAGAVIAAAPFPDTRCALAAGGSLLHAGLSSGSSRHLQVRPRPLLAVVSCG